LDKNQKIKQRIASYRNRKISGSGFMSANEMNELKEELEQFKKEKQAIRNLVGQIGGANSSKYDKIMNALFLGLLGVLFFLDILRHCTELDLELIPAMFSLELAVLLVSLKIIWMIHKQTKVEHFQFWILNSIEFRLNDIAKRVRGIEKKTKDL
jgi:cell shape-determining protein MreC